MSFLTPKVHQRVNEEFEKEARIVEHIKLNYSLCSCARPSSSSPFCRWKRIFFNFPAKVRSGVMPAFVEADTRVPFVIIQKYLSRFRPDVIPRLIL